MPADGNHFDEAIMANLSLIELQNRVFVVTRTATESGKMIFEANVATAKNHLNDEQIITVICDTGDACKFLIEDKYRGCLITLSR